MKLLAHLLLASVCAHRCGTTAQLRITPEHRDFIALIEDSSYRNENIHKLFQRLESKGDAVCEMIFQMRPYDEALARQFSRTLEFRKDPKEKWYNNVLPTMLAGCFNFFKMNDRGVHKTMALVEGLYPEAKDCYTVGFTQFYLMFQQMRCKRFAAIDIDWRILKAHYDFQSLARANRQHSDTLTLLQHLELGWIAHFDIRPPQTRAGEK